MRKWVGRMPKIIIDPEELRKREDRYRQVRAITYLLQGIKYIMSYLPDYPLHLIPDFTHNPIVVTIKIYWGIEDIQVEAMPPLLKDRLDRITEELSKISEAVVNAKIPQPEKEDRVDQLRLPFNVRKGDE